MVKKEEIKATRKQGANMRQRRTIHENTCFNISMRERERETGEIKPEAHQLV